MNVNICNELNFKLQNQIPEKAQNKFCANAGSLWSEGDTQQHQHSPAATSELQFVQSIGASKHLGAKKPAFLQNFCIMPRRHLASISKQRS